MMSADLQEQLNSYTEGKRREFTESQVSRTSADRRVTESSHLLENNVRVTATERRDKCYCARELMRSAGISCQVANNTLEVCRLPLTDDGVAVQVHFLWPVLLAIVSIPAFRLSAMYGVFTLVLCGPVLFMTILVHEVGHVVAALWCGGRATHILLWPLGGLAFVSDFGDTSPRADAIVAMAGPATHIPQFLVWYFLMYVSNSGVATLGWPVGWGWNFWLSLCSSAMLMQIVLFLFNLVPAYPLDGGRLLCALLTQFGFRRDTTLRATAWVGSMFGWYFLFTGLRGTSASHFTLLTGWSQACIALFILYNCFNLWSRGARGATDQHSGYQETVGHGGNDTARNGGVIMNRDGDPTSRHLFSLSRTAVRGVGGADLGTRPIAAVSPATAPAHTTAAAPKAKSGGWTAKGPGIMLGSAPPLTPQINDPAGNINNV